MSTLRLPPDEFAVLKKVIKALSPETERDALKELVREVVREEMAAAATLELHQHIAMTPEQVEEFGREMDKAIRRGRARSGRPPGAVT